MGGPSTPGVLVVRRELLTTRVPDEPGGGTVAYVNQTDHRYVTDPAQREEGGTPVHRITPVPYGSSPTQAAR